MSGVTIGDGAIIGARALVTSDVPPYAIYAGIPARLIRYRFPSELVERLLQSRWWNFSMARLSKMRVNEPEACLNEMSQLDNGAVASYHQICITRQGAKLIGL